jgi:hypothetical protein
VKAVLSFDEHHSAGPFFIAKDTHPHFLGKQIAREMVNYFK